MKCRDFLLESGLESSPERSQSKEHLLIRFCCFTAGRKKKLVCYRIFSRGKEDFKSSWIQAVFGAERNSRALVKRRDREKRKERDEEHDKGFVRDVSYLTFGTDFRNSSI